mgnify:CR=1 FL=1
MPDPTTSPPHSPSPMGWDGLGIQHQISIAPEGETRAALKKEEAAAQQQKPNLAKELGKLWKNDLAEAKAWGEAEAELDLAGENLAEAEAMAAAGGSPESPETYFI